MSRIRRPYHVHLRRLEDDGTWSIIKTASDGDDLVVWFYQQRLDRSEPPGLYETRDCELFACAPQMVN